MSDLFPADYLKVREQGGSPLKYSAAVDRQSPLDPKGGETATYYLEDSSRRHLITGGSFSLDLPPAVQPIWGNSSEALWASGESLIVTSPAGLIKTTLNQRLMRARLGLDTEVLGYPVELATKPVLYVAADRPRQIQRSMARMVKEEERERLDEMLIVHRGPLPFDAAKEPERLGAWVEELGAGTLIIDSLKDVALDLAKDETGSRVNRALAGVIQAGVEVLVSHHQRKSVEGRQPKALDEVYGSTWITAGAGSVLLFWGKPGDPVVSMHHLKQPCEEVGPLNVAIDFTTGGLSVDAGTDLPSILRGAPRGLTAKEAARVLFGVSDPDRAEEAKARRKLQKLVADGWATSKSGGSNGALKQPDRFFSISFQGEIGR